MRLSPLALVFVALAAVAACGADAEADHRADSATPPTVALPALGELGELSTVPPVATVTPSAPPRPSDVVVVGDSLTVSAEDEIAVALADRDHELLALDAVEGRRTAADLAGKPSGVSAVEELSAEHTPDVWVIALGTNDVGGQAQPDDFRAAVEALLAELPGGARVVWLDMWIEGRVDGCVELNAVLRDVAGSRSNMEVVDWFQFGDDPGITVADGVHLTDAGQLAFAEQIADAVSATDRVGAPGVG